MKKQYIVRIKSDTGETISELTFKSLKNADSYIHSAGLSDYDCDLCVRIPVEKIEVTKDIPLAVRKGAWS